MQMVIYGKNPVKEAIRARIPLRTVWMKKGFKADFTDVLKFLCKDVRIVHPKIIEAVCGSPEHQGIAAKIEWSPPPPDVVLKKISSHFEKRPGRPRFAVFLDEVQDVANIGNIIRSADFFGAVGVILSERGSPKITPPLVKASAGAVFHIPVVRMAKEQVIGFARAEEAKIYVFDVKGDISIWEVEFQEPALLVFGSEGAGVSEQVRKNADFIINIPPEGMVSSLNVASTAAIALFEFSRQMKKYFERKLPKNKSPQPIKKH